MKCDKYMGMDVHQATTVVVSGCGRQSDFGDDRANGGGGNDSIGAKPESVGQISGMSEVTTARSSGV
jgi:hypothetical protein